LERAQKANLSTRLKFYHSKSARLHSKFAEKKEKKVGK